TLLFLGADSVLSAMSKRLAAKPGRGATTPGGLFGDALRIVMAPDGSERERLKRKVRNRMPLHLFRCIHYCQYAHLAFMLPLLLTAQPKRRPGLYNQTAGTTTPQTSRPPQPNCGGDDAKNEPRLPLTREAKLCPGSQRALFRPFAEPRRHSGPRSSAAQIIGD